MAGTTSFKVFFVALEDNGVLGKKIGCDDSVVAVERTIEWTAMPLAAAMGALLSIQGRSGSDGSAGLYNALARSHLTVESVALIDGAAEIRLLGIVRLGGACDVPRIDAQLRETVLQFQEVETVAVFVNGVPLPEVLSSQG